MRQVWKFRLGWVSVLGLAGMLLMSGGCGGGGGDDDNGVGAVVEDTTPDAFSFTPQTNVPPGTTVTSETVTITGINAPTSISISGGGSFSVGGGTYTSTAGTVESGQTVAVRQLAPATNSTVTTSTVTIGGVSAPFTFITAPPAGADVTPAPFTFAPQTGVAVGTVATSAPITITGIDSPTPIIITGGTYSINGGAYTSNPGVVSNGQTVTLRHTTSATANTPTTTTVTIGGVSGAFTTKTAAGGASDTTPDAFQFGPHITQYLANPASSGGLIVTGINAPAPISISNGTYSIDGGSPTSMAGTVNNGQMVIVRHTTASTHSTMTTSILTIGGVSATFISITGPPPGADIVPEPFSFTPQTNVPHDTVATSAPITITGIDNPTYILIKDGTYSVNGGPFTSDPGLASNGQTVAVRHTSAAAGSNTTRLWIGVRSADFITTTRAAVGNDITPNPFRFTPLTGVQHNWLITSTPVYITGIDRATPISVTGGTYSIDNKPFTSEPGTISNWAGVKLRHTSSATRNTVTTTTLTIGDVSVPFTTTTDDTSVDNRPDNFTFTTQTDVPRYTYIVSNPITVSGIDAPAQIYIDGGGYSIDGGAYTLSPGTVTNGQTVTVRHTSSAAVNTRTTTTLTIGGVTGSFTSTTVLDDAASLYSRRCSGCHRLGTVDRYGTAPNLAGATSAQLEARFPTPTTVHHGESLTTEERNALAAYFLSIPTGT